MLSLSVGFMVTGLLLSESAPTPDAPLIGATTNQTNSFQVGRARFAQVTDAPGGLGPAYNGTSCSACHNQPFIGGIGNAAVMRAGIIKDGHYEAPPGGDL